MPASYDDLDTEPESERAGSVAPAPTVDAARLPVLAKGDLAAAEAALEKAEDDHAAAEDALADLEAQIAVLEMKAVAIEADQGAEAWRQAEARANLAAAQRAFRRAGIRVERAEHKITSATALVDAEVAALLKALATPAADEEPATPRFATVELFVAKFVLPNLVHKYAETRLRWCAKWWEHAEAITRLEALWEAFEVMRLQPAPSFSTWLRDHFDVHMRTLTDPEGVFYNCNYKKDMHEPKEPWPSAAAPEGMFAVIETAQVQPPAPSAAPVAAEEHGGTVGGVAMDAAAARRTEARAEGLATAALPQSGPTRHHTKGAAR